MNRTKLLLDVVRDMRSLANSIQQHGQVYHGREEQRNHGHVPGRDGDKGIIHEASQTESVWDASFLCCFLI